MEAAFCTLIVISQGLAQDRVLNEATVWLYLHYQQLDYRQKFDQLIYEAAVRFEAANLVESSQQYDIW